MVRNGSLMVKEKGKKRSHDAIQAMNTWFESFRKQIREPPLLTFQELKNRKTEKMDKTKKMNKTTPQSAVNR